VDRTFEAADLIEVMEEAVHYNRFLIDELVAWSHGAPRLLDFGAGNGRFSRALHEQHLSVRAIEPDPELRERIRSYGIPSHASLDALGELRFDGIYSINVLEHIQDDRAILSAMHEHLEPGGRLLLYVPAFQVLFSANDERVGHVRRYRRPDLIDSLRATGFRIEDASYVDSIGFVAALWYRWFGDREGRLDPRSVRLYDSVVFPVSRRFDAALRGSVGKNLLVRATRPALAQAEQAPGSG